MFRGSSIYKRAMMALKTVHLNDQIVINDERRPVPPMIHTHNSIIIMFTKLNDEGLINNVNLIELFLK